MSRPIAAAVALALGLGACDGTSPDDDGGNVVELEITESAAELSPGEARSFVVAAYDADGGEIPDPELEWTSSDTDVATVSSDGMVTAVGTGTASITATAGDVQASAALEVVSTWSVITVGGSHSCGVTLDGAAYCWGLNTWGQLGDGTTTTRVVPTPVQGGHSFVQLSAGYRHTCGLTAAGEVWCWGNDFRGELGDGGGPDASAPQLVPGGLTFADIRAGIEHTCGVTTDGDGYCWGTNAEGELGGGSTGAPAGPTLVAGDITWHSIDPWGNRMTCGMSSTGQGYCWGSGMLGSDVSETAAPAAVDGSQVYESVGTVFNGGCGRIAGGDVYCWGQQTYGTVGSGEPDDAPAPVIVSTAESFEIVDAGGSHVCALTPAGDAWCWGDNGNGALGVTATETCGGGVPCERAPVAVSGGHRFSSISAGEATTCAVTSGGAGYCWGRGVEGQLGDGHAISGSGPVRVQRPAAD